MVGLRRLTLVVAALIGWVVVSVAAQASPAQGGRERALTNKDRAEIQDLVARYAVALGSCAAEDYADVFAPGDGYFFSTIRGEVVGRDHLILLVQSERHCNTPPAPNPGAGPAPPARSNAVPTVAIEASADGATGKAVLGAAGGYEDAYVRTPKGWRIKARTVITPAEAAAKLTAQDFVALRRLAGNDLGQYEDVYTNTPQGRRFRSQGVFFGLLPDGGVKGTAILRDNVGRYDDVYVRTTTGGWRFQSRTFVPTDAVK